MATAETARLIAELTLKDKLTPGVKTASASIGKLETRLGGLGTAARRGAGVAVKSIASIGAVAVGGLTLAIKSGLDDLATLEDATTSVDGAIRQLGLTGKVTGAQVADWANQIEADVGAAFDDKAITQATTTLIRFGHVTPGNLRPAMVVMTDLAAKTGDVDSAATLLAKALADPTKAAGKLARQGIVLTKTQQEQIKAFVKAGKIGAAQKIILDALTTSTKGAAAASQGPYRRALSLLADASEDAKKALAMGFLPIIERVASKLNTELAKPSTIANIRNFGEGLARGFDKALSLAEKIPWGTIGSGLQTAAEWGGKFLDLFVSMPPEVQTTIIALAGLNKLTGGAVSSIVTQLGTGLIKGVLGMTAGIVNIKAAVVNGAGGPAGGAAPTAGGAATGAAASGAVVPIIGALAPPLDFSETKAEANRLADKLGLATDAAGVFGKRLLDVNLPPRPKGPSAGHEDLQKPATIFNALKRDGIDLGAIAQRRLDSLSQSAKDQLAATHDTGSDVTSAVEKSKTSTRNALSVAQGAIVGGVAGARVGISSATTAAGNTVASAVRNLRLPTPQVFVYVTATSVTTSVTSSSRTSNNTSRQSGSNRTGFPT